MWGPPLWHAVGDPAPPTDMAIRCHSYPDSHVSPDELLAPRRSCRIRITAWSLRPRRSLADDLAKQDPGTCRGRGRIVVYGPHCQPGAAPWRHSEPHIGSSHAPSVASPGVRENVRRLRLVLARPPATRPAARAVDFRLQRHVGRHPNRGRQGRAERRGSVEHGNGGQAEAFRECPKCGSVNYSQHRARS